MDISPIQIAGAGPAGLAAAITLAQAGRSVIVHEAGSVVGYRFRRDLQGLENWSAAVDVVSELRSLGITTAFTSLPCRHGRAFDAWDREYLLQSDRPFFYMVERGPGEGSLDNALLAQARELGVEVRFNSRVKGLSGPAIFATGPQSTEALSVGYHFDTTMDDGFWVVCDDQLAPQGYAYLLTMGGKGTVKSCMFRGFKQQARYVQRTVATFERLLGLRMIKPRPHGGVGHFALPATACRGEVPIAGEQAGFQDVLWGFGMRVAINSGVIAARTLLEGGDYDTRWRQALDGALRSSVVNRAVYGRLGNRGYRWLLSRLENRTDALLLLRKHYGPSRLKQFLAPLAGRLI